MAGKNLPCMVSDLLEGNSSSPEQEDAIKFVAATAYSGMPIIPIIPHL